MEVLTDDIIIGKLESVDFITVTTSLSQLGLDRNSKVSGFAPIIHVALSPPNPQIKDLTSIAALDLLDFLYTRPNVFNSVVSLISRCVDFLQQNPTIADNFLFIGNTLGDEQLLWELAFFYPTEQEEIEATDQEAIELTEQVNAQQTIKNYIESNIEYPFSGGVEPVDEEDLGLPPRPVLIPMPDSPIRRDRTLTRLPTRRTVQKVKPQFERVADGKQKVYGLISIFVSASALYLLQKQMAKK